MKKYIDNEYLIMSLLVVTFSVLLEKIAFPSESFNAVRLIIIIGIIFLFLVLMRLVDKIGIEKKIKSILQKIGINKIFIVFALIIGITCSILIPLNEIPDEITHINFTYEERGLDVKFKDVNSGYVGTRSVMKNNKNKVNKSQYFDFSKKINMKKIFGIPNIKIIRHLPQAIAMIIGEILHLPVIVYLFLCELFALIFYIFVCNKALVKMPFKKELLMFIMLLPVCIQQMASMSYDVVLNSIFFLYLATILDLKYRKDSINLIDILKLLFYILIITICKIPYIVVALLIFILPLSKIKLNIGKVEINYNVIKDSYNKYKKILMPIVLLALLFICILGIKVLLKMSIGRVLISSIIHPKSTLLLFYRTIKMYLSYFFDSIAGDLGIFNIKTPVYYEIYLYLMLLFTVFSFNKDDKKNKLSKMDNLIIYGLALVLIYVIILSMFEWTLDKSGVKYFSKLNLEEIHTYLNILPFIGGVQGRYFIPVIPLLLVPLKSVKLKKVLNKLSPYTMQTVYYISLLVYMITVLVYRFWL